MDRSKWDWGDFGKIDGIVVNGGSMKHTAPSSKKSAAHFPMSQVKTI